MGYKNCLGWWKNLIDWFSLVLSCGELLNAMQPCMKDIFYNFLGGGFKYFYFHPYLGNISDMTKVFRMGWNHQLDLHYFVLVAWNLCRCFFCIFQSCFMLHEPHVKSSPTPWPVITPVVLRWFVHSSVQMLKFWWLAVVDPRCLSKCTWKAAIWCTPLIHSLRLMWNLKNEHLTKGGFRLW